MAQVYAAPPQGGLFNIPDTLPQGLLYRYKKISNLSRQNLKVPPNNGQGDVWAGQKIIVTLPQNALIDLSTFTMDFKGYTQHNGSNNAATVGPLNYCQGRFFPRNTQSLIGLKSAVTPADRGHSEPGARASFDGTCLSQLGQ